MERRFKDRTEGGRELAQALLPYKNNPDLLILALPRGGVPVAYEVARSLQAPLDVFIVRKLGVPGHEELAMGAIASGGQVVMNEEVESLLHISPEKIREIVKRENATIEAREKAYHKGESALPIEGKTIILIDDGLATGSTMQVAIKAIKDKNPKRIVVAVPVAPPDTCQTISEMVDELICLRQPSPFHAVGLWYADFDQTTDEEVSDLLERAKSFRLRPAIDQSRDGRPEATL